MVPVYTGNTRFRNGSFPKLLKKAGPGILMDQGKIDLDALVRGGSVGGNSSYTFKTKLQYSRSWLTKALYR